MMKWSSLVSSSYYSVVTSTYHADTCGRSWLVDRIDGLVGWWRVGFWGCIVVGWHATAVWVFVGWPCMVRRGRRGGCEDGRRLGCWSVVANRWRHRVVEGRGFVVMGWFVLGRG